MGAVVRVTHGPNGLGHALGTVRKMAALANAGAHDYSIRQLATRITRNVPSKDARGELAALYVWVRDNVRYRQDPRGLELVQSPRRTLIERAGDCDDIATLLSALAQSIGHRMRYRTVGPTTDDQRHVSTEGQCYGEWVSVDPVLEPPRATTAPSASLGAFGQRAPGAAIYYSETGQPMGLHGTASSALWPSTALEQGYATASLGPSAYRSAGAPGGGRYRSLVPIWRNPYDASDLSGLGADMRRVRDFNTGDVSRDAANFAWAGLTAAERRPFKNAIDRWNRIGKDDRVSSRASWTALLSEVPNYTAQQARAWWGGLSKNQRQARRKKYTKGYGDDFLTDVANVTKSVVQVVPVYGQVIATGINAAQGQGAFKDPLKAAAFIVGGQAGGQIAPFVSSKGLRLTPTALKEAVKYNVDIMSSASSSSPAGSMSVPQLPANVQAAGSQVAQVVKRIPSSAIPVGARRVGRIVGKVPQLSAQQVAAQLRQRATTGVSALVRRVVPMRRVLTPQQFDAMRAQLARGGQALAGLSLNWSLSGTTDSAAAAVAAVSAFIKRTGKPPQISLPAVLAMQGEIPGLVKDGLWGNNTRKAAAWALSKPEPSLPAVTPGWAKRPATWQPPTAAVVPAPAPAAPPATKPAPSPAPKPTTTAAPRPTTTPAPAAPKPLPPATSAPAGSKVVTRKQLAQRAIDQVRAFIKKNGKPPAIALANVRTYQQAAGLGVDGLYGDEVRKFAAVDLGVKASSLPKPHVWKKKSTTPAASKPAAPVVVVAPAPSSPVAPKPPPAPSSPSSSTPSRRDFAQRAVDAVRAFIAKKGKPPQVSVAAVRTYQGKAKLEQDGLWGDATRNAAARDLGVDASSLPPIAAAFQKKKKKPTSSSPPAPPVVVQTPQGPVVVQPVQEQQQSDWPVPPSSGPFAPPPAPPEPPSNSPPFAPPPAPPEPKSSSGQGLLIALAVAAFARRKRRAA